jgi:type IV pilus assembly protein PilA
MITKFTTKAKSEQGFTLVELLVVMLIIGLLAAIAIPAFFNQRSKANDASAKEAVRTAQTALETFATDNGGAYTNATVAKLQLIEGAVPPACDSSSSNAPCISALTVASDNYTVTVKAKTTLNTYSITRASSGGLGYPCTVVSSNRGGCPGTGTVAGTWN